MSYIIKKTNGQVLITLQDGTLDTTKTSITLVGKNYPGYGEIANDNLVRLLENFANNVSPANPLAGQIWYDTGNARLSVYNGSVFKGTSATFVSTTSPTQNANGDFWYNPNTGQLSVYNGSIYTLIGPTTVNNILNVASLYATDVVQADSIIANSASITGQVEASRFVLSASPYYPDNRVLFTGADGPATHGAFISDSTFTFDPTTKTLRSTTMAATLGSFVTGNFYAGTVGTPSITSNTDPTTGIWFPQANTIAVGASGTEHVRINGYGGLQLTPFNLMSNAYYGAGWQYKAGGAAAMLSASSGAFLFQTAASGLTNGSITWHDALSVDSTGLLVSGGIALGSGGPFMYVPSSNTLAFATTGTIGSPTNQALTISGSGITLGVAGTTQGNLNIAGSASGTVTVTTKAAAGSWTMTLPANTGSAGQVLTTDGAGITSWGFTGSSGGGGTGYTGSIGPSGPSGYTGSQGTAAAAGAPLWRHVSPGYTVGGQVFVSSSTPVASNQGDIWLDTNATAGYSQSLATNGWTMLPNGLKMAWGTASVTAIPDTTVTYPVGVNFTTVYSAQATIVNPTNNQALDWFAQIVSFSSASIVLTVQGAYGTSGTGPYNVCWFAIGS